MNKKRLHIHEFLCNRKIYIFFTILFMGVGFSYLTSGLNITGNAAVSGNSWNVYFDNIQVTNGSVASELPTITNKTMINYSVSFEKPGDFYEFSVDCVNDGTIDAMVDSVVKSSLNQNLGRIIDYIITDVDGNEISKNDVLEAGDSVTYKIFTQYKRDILESDLLSENVSLDLSFSVNYVQLKDLSLKRTNYGYVWDFDYSGQTKSFKAPFSENYKIELWGAQGGSTSIYGGGYGAYVTGKIDLEKDEKIYLYVGESGKWYSNYSTNQGTYNSGGGATFEDANWSGGTGGGLTSVSKYNNYSTTINNCTPINTSEYYNNLIMIAAGGGGSVSGVENHPGGHAGGFQSNSISSNINGNKSSVLGATQSTPGYNSAQSTKTSGGFGYGGQGYYGPGGGAGYYGGGGGYGSAATGGSSYFDVNEFSEAAMYCYSCSESNGEGTKTISNTNVSETPVSQYSKIGDGYARVIYNSSADILFQVIDVEETTNISRILYNYNTGTITFNTDLSNVGDIAEFSFDVKNNSEKPYYLNEILKNTFDNTKINYTVSSMSGFLLEKNDILQSGASETVHVRLELLDSDSSINSQLFSLFLGYKESVQDGLHFGTVWNIGYEGEEKEFSVPATGAYKLEVWGAQGGTIYGGYGGYSTGIVELDKNTTLYINVGGQGGDASIRTGGYNGGGAGGIGYNANYLNGSGGGGATHIATQSGLLSTLSESVNSILIVAGGGGGTVGDGWCSYRGGSGGGMQGTIGSIYRTHNDEAGTQSSTSRSVFGQGTKGRNATLDDYGAEGNGGGGGGFYGGVASTSVGRYTDAAGPGGSGYIGNADLTKKVMYCYKCTSSSVESTKTVSTNNALETPISRYAKIGNGYARITYIGS